MKQNESHQSTFFLVEEVAQRIEGDLLSTTEI